MNQPIGKQMRALLQASEELGRAVTGTELFQAAGIQSKSTNRTRVCKRAVGHGFMEVDDSVKPMLFQAATDWRELLADHDAKPQPKRRKATPSPMRDTSRMFNSVWMLAA